MNSAVRSYAGYAVADDAGRGRVHVEARDRLRPAFVLDRHRVLSCTAFRRVRSKTQVYGGEHDHYRTRLTHTLEVADIARVLALGLDANETLAETIALAHDLGHAPFGHAGEQALGLLMVDHGGFEHNLHALRVVDYLEHPFPAFRGLNLTYEVREGLVKHVTLFDAPAVDEADPDPALQDLMSSGPSPTVEAQIASLADRLAYDMHDLEDAIGAGFIDLATLNGVALWREACTAAGLADAPLAVHAIRRPVLDAMLNHLLYDAVECSRAEMADLPGVDAVRARRRACVGLSEAVNADLREVERLLFDRFYRRAEVARMDERAHTIIRELFVAYVDHPGALPARFAGRVGEQGVHRVVCDYIAGMTDRFCIVEHGRLVGSANRLG